MSSQHLGEAELARRLESIRQAAEAAERARQQADQIRQPAPTSQEGTP
ncbi:hypothetical protein ACIQWA_36665 [Kitasatospora sp. NPDC098652]